MKKVILLSFLALTSIAKAQDWSLTGNAGTTPGTNFIGTTDNQDLVFKTNGTEKMRIKSSGNVIVGNPNYISYNNINTNDTFVSAGTSAFYLQNGDSSFKITDSSLGWNYMRVAASDEYDSAVYLQESDGKVVIGSSASPYCTSCNGYKLFVKDGIKTEKVKVEIAAENGWADYVFAKDYKLMPLKEVETYINTNGHLPEVPSTEEAIQNGIELKEMNILLLKKVEELTLHAIEQNKRIEKLEANAKK